jgi:hypothetical protein
MLAMLDPIVAALRKRGIRAWHFFPGYVQIEGHDFVYSPSIGQLSLLHTKDTQGPWTRLMEYDCNDKAEQIADRILAHISIYPPNRSVQLEELR